MKAFFSLIFLLCSVALQPVQAQSYSLMHSFYGPPDLTNSVDMNFTLGGEFLVARIPDSNPTGFTDVLSPRRRGSNGFTSNIWKNWQGISVGIPSVFSHYGSNNFPANQYTNINSGIEFGKYYMFKLRNTSLADAEGILMEFNTPPAGVEFIGTNLLHETTPNTPVKVVIRISDTLANNQHFYLRYRHSADPINVYQWVKVNFAPNSRFGTATIPGLATIGTVSFKAFSMYRSFESITDNSYGNSIYEITGSGTSENFYQIVSQPVATLTSQFAVNMTGRTVSSDGVYLQIETGKYIALTNVGNNIYSVSLKTKEGSSYNYRFANGLNMEVVPTACGVGISYKVREFISTAATPSPATVCFSNCVNNCSASNVTVNIKFRVDMTGQVVGAGGVKLVGSFNGFSAFATPMASIGNNVYEASVPVLANSTVTYKFVNGTDFETVPGACGVNDGNGNINRSYTTPLTDATIPAVCFGACSSNCNTTPTTAAITFRVNMTGQTVAASGIKLAGTFNAFSATANPMTSIGNNVYETTVNLPIGSTQTYKFVNGTNYEIVPTACGVNDGNGNINRSYTVPSTATSLPTVCFGACTNSCGSGFTTAPITFRVNMTGQTVAASGIKLAGTFNGFSATANPMTHLGGNVYETTVILTIGSVQAYKFVNGTNYEIVPAACGVNDGVGNINRSYTVPSLPTTLAVVCFGACSNSCSIAPTTAPITFRVNMTGQTVTPAGMKLAGTFNGFSVTSNPMTNVGNNVYETTLNLTIGSVHTYKFVNGTNFEIVPSACGVNDGNGNLNRSYTVASTATTLPTVCFGTCSNTCSNSPTTAPITFRVNMTGQTVAPASMKLAGTFNSFSPTANPMTSVGNNVYETTVNLPVGSVQAYKFVNGTQYEFVPAACGSDDGNGNINRTYTVPSTVTTIPVVCFGECTNCPSPTASVITFAVDMSLYPPTNQGIFLAGSFNGFSTTATPMTLAGNQVYKVTLNLPQNTQQTFKFVRGSEFELIPQTCGILGGQSVYDRFVDVTTQDQTLNTVCWGACTACSSVSVQDPFRKANTIRAYPNPAENDIQLDFGASEEGTGRLELYDGLGKSVFSEAIQWHQGRYLLNLKNANLAPGLFQIRVVEPEKVWVQTIIKQ